MTSGAIYGLSKKDEQLAEAASIGVSNAASRPFPNRAACCMNTGIARRFETEFNIFSIEPTTNFTESTPCPCWKATAQEEWL